MFLKTFFLQKRFENVFPAQNVSVKRFWESDFSKCLSKTFMKAIEGAFGVFVQFLFDMSRVSMLLNRTAEFCGFLGLVG